MTSIFDRIAAFGQARIVVFGDAMLDRSIYGEVRRISPEAAAPVFSIESEDLRLGGAANVARNVASLGSRVHLVSAIGQDADGDRLAALSREDDLITASLVRDPGRPSTVKTRFIASGQQVLRADLENASPVRPEILARLLDELGAALATADCLICSDYAKGVLTPDGLVQAIAMARSRGLPVIVDPKARDMARYAGASVITPNALEAAGATGLECDSDEGIGTAASAISQIAAGATVVITRGRKGMSVFEPGSKGGGRLTHLPTLGREVHDVTGAGDTAVATLSLAIASGAPILEAAHLANVAAGIAVASRGTAVVHPSQLLLHALSSAPEPEVAKIVPIETAAKVTALWRRERLATVFANGCFDLLHPGHLGLLGFARRQGDKLVVAINSDASASRLKGPGRPVQSEHVRARMLAALSIVDMVIVFPEDTPLSAIEALRPHVLVKGSDYTETEVIGGDFVRAAGGHVALAPLEPGFSTTAILASRGSHS